MSQAPSVIANLVARFERNIDAYGTRGTTKPNSVANFSIHFLKRLDGMSQTERDMPKPTRMLSMKMPSRSAALPKPLIIAFASAAHANFSSKQKSRP